ncbi:PEP/pyruvate-binding domain-containing protein [Desulfovibrio sp. UCD-KL4C]|uniref:PEP/pyruvate-binding domain-containing protein n=1 Tax=Desulfovibrio sp. UCD-KL4C TaxID=2578120 RepID=UPI0025BDC071|nr:PEP/pyruvate-binding domain-containing protein [Desulfovibrio sp. UCD-KL4C]
MNVALGTKAETLKALLNAGFNVPKVFYFKTEEWEKDLDAILNSIYQNFAEYNFIIVRSSAIAEDGHTASAAGAFESILNIDINNRCFLKKAITKVIASYDRSEGDQVLIQPMISDIEASGVIMTRCLEDGSPYYVINYDDESGKTDSITGGSGASKTIYIYKGFSLEDFSSKRVKKMMELVYSLEKVFLKIPLDIEFALDRNFKMHLFQVRKICTVKNWHPNVESIVSTKIRFVENFVSNYFKKRFGVFGERTILGVMPDWNPAEIIGVTPKPLAASLYREIITRSTWRKSREMMGYKKNAPEELMVLVAGRPYIDVRNSFNSFLPAGLKPEVAEKVVSGYIERLDNNPKFHDKVEFEIAATIFDPCFDDNFKRRYPSLLTESEFNQYREKLLELTNFNLDQKNTLLPAYESIELLKSRQKMYPKLSCDISFFELTSILRSLLDDCIEFGTIPFSIIARHGFIAESLLRSLIHKKGISKERVEEFKRSITTVSGEMSKHFNEICSSGGDNEVAKKDFIAKYGHLRPGTYDILSLKYSDRENLFLNISSCQTADQIHKDFVLSSSERKAMNKILTGSGIESVDAEFFLEYAAKAISGREYAKFIFTRNLSLILDGLGLWGEKIGLAKEEVAMLNLPDIMDSLYSHLDSSVYGHYEELVRKGKKQYELANYFKLSYLIRSSADVYVVPQHRCAPNFITSKRVEAPIVIVSNTSTESENLAGAIVCIESADPGYDWIFTRKIAGLVTKYGGTNSHMAIRCAEYGLPAVIGCGEMLYDKISGASFCCLDADLKKITPCEMK